MVPAARSGLVSSRKLGAYLGAGVVLLLAACNGIIGITDITAASDAGSGGGLSFDGSLPDAGVDATADGSVDAGDSSRAPDDAGDSAIAPEDGGDGGVQGGCPSGTLACDGGCLPNDTRNCGACGHDCTNLPHVSGQVTCGAGGVCTFGASACAPGYAQCGDAGPDEGCGTPVDTTSNCGACGVTCAGGTPDCAGSGSAYACASGCSGSQTLCGSTCVDTTSDPSNCKTCGNLCTTSVGHATATCVTSACNYSCNTNYTPCNGGCVDYQNDNNNCGGCGTQCDPGTMCSGGSCVCNTTTGCAGCCSNNACEIFGSQSTSQCGYGGAACGTCPVAGEICASVSSGGQCQCPSGDTNCSGTCVNVNASDATNCGACGHNCLGGTCSAGVCQPALFVTSGCAPSGLTSDGTTVYFSSNCGANITDQAGQIFSCLGSGCPSATSLAGPGQPTGQILVSGGTLYWVDLPKKGYTATVQSCKAASCTPTGIGSLVTGGIATNGTNVYWWENTNLIEACSIASCTPVQFTAATSLNGGPFSVAADSSTVFWTDSSIGKVMSCAATSGACASPATVASGRTSPDALTTDGANVYWSDAAGVFQCPVGGCGGAAPTLLASGQQNANSIVSDGTYVYWATGSSIVRARVGQASSALTIAPNQTGAGTIGVGNQAVYWSLSSGNLMLLAK